MSDFSKINILIACEFTGIVRNAFAGLGFNVWSCDLLPSLLPGNHFQCDFHNVLDKNWDMLIAFPPCTYLSNVSSIHRKNINRLPELAKSLQLFYDLFSSNIHYIAIENPVGLLSTCFRKPDQIIHPYYFNGFAKKRTCLWLKNLPPLLHNPGNNLFFNNTHGFVSDSFNTTGYKNYSKWYNNNKSERSKTFNSIAEAMALQWSSIFV